MKERRRTPRANCRLNCRVTRGRDRVRARIVDISEGGLCFLSPVWFKPKQQAEVSIDVPGTGMSSVKAEIWHIRREKGRSGQKVWVVGVMLSDADEAYENLLRAAGVASEGGQAEAEAHEADPTPETDPVEEIRSRVYRIRCKARGGPRTRVLTMAAPSQADARSLAIRDLGDAWSVLEIREAKAKA